MIHDLVQIHAEVATSPCSTDSSSQRWAGTGWTGRRWSTGISQRHKTCFLPAPCALCCCPDHWATSFCKLSWLRDSLDKNKPFRDETQGATWCCSHPWPSEELHKGLFCSKQELHCIRDNSLINKKLFVKAAVVICISPDSPLSAEREFKTEQGPETHAGKQT